MLILASTSDLVSVVTGSALNTDVHASWVDLVDAATTATPGRTNTATISTATTTTVVGSPGASTKRTVKHLSIRNRDAASSNAITVKHTDGSNNLELIKVTLAAGEELLYLDHAWFVYDTTGAVRASTGAATDTSSGSIEIAVQSELETATDTVRAVPPGRVQYHPGVSKAWVDCGVTANILGSYNITSLTDTGTGDVAVTIATDFSAATTYTWVVAVQRTNSTAAAANARQATVKTGTLAAGTVSADCWDDTATTNVISDPTTWHMIGMGDQA